MIISNCCCIFLMSFIVIDVRCACSFVVALSTDLAAMVMLFCAFVSVIMECAVLPAPIINISLSFMLHPSLLQALIKPVPSTQKASTVGFIASTFALLSFLVFGTSVNICCLKGVVIFRPWP